VANAPTKLDYRENVLMSDDVNQVGTPGGSFMSKVAKLVADGAIYGQTRMGPVRKQIGRELLDDFTNHMSDEAREALSPLLRLISNSPDINPEVGQLFKFMAEARGQWQMLAAGTTTGALMSGGLFALFTNELNPVILPIIAANPNGILTPSDAAAAYARRLGGPPDWDQEARKGGISWDRFKTLVELHRPQIPFIQILELYNREAISRDVAVGELKAHGFGDNNINRILSLSHQLLTPEQLAAMVNRDIVSLDDGERIAKRSGVDAEDFHRLTLLGGDPLAVGDLAVAYRRGFIDRETFEHGIIQGPLRKEWFPVLEQLQFNRMSTVDAADAVNQGHMSADDGARVAHENGMEPEDFRVLLKTAGQPPGVEFAQEAWLRGFITEDQFDTMFLESRIKNIYLPLLKKMATRLVPQETMRMLYRKGVYTVEQLARGLLEHGFSESDAEALIAAEQVERTATTRELTRAQIVDLYEEQIISLSEAVEMLIGMGYDDNEARAMVELADMARLRKFVNSAISKVKSAYVNGHTDEVTASAQLDALRVPNEQRDSLFFLWDIERTTITKTLTPSQIRQAFKKDLMPRNDALARLINQGYDEGDADLFLQLTA
jgi:hypothetical protein